MNAELQELLRTRATAYKERVADDETDPFEEYLIFDASGDPYALPTRHVETLVQRPVVTAVPKSPHAYLGVFSLRGNIFDAYCMSRLMQKDDPPHHNFILVKHNKRIIGLRVETIDRIGKVYESERQDLPRDSRFAFITHTLTDGTYILDIPALISNLSV